MSALSYREAAARVGRSRRAVQRWRRNGMPMGFEWRNGQRVRVVDEEVLLAWFWERLAADPVHQARLRKAMEEEFDMTKYTNQTNGRNEQ